MKWLAAAAVAIALVGCLPQAGDAPTIDCGPLDEEQCRKNVQIAQRHLAASFPDQTVTHIEFTDDRGAYVVTFSDGTQAGVTQSLPTGQASWR